jgi:formylmethanofuran dehydrogenase subunit A
MDRGFRKEQLAQLHPDAQAMTTLGTLQREYTLHEIAILTRAAPARLLGLADMGHLGTGARADITVYRDLPDRERMFGSPEYVFKDGEVVVRDGKVVAVGWGRYHTVRPEFDRGIERRLGEHFARYHTIRSDHLRISDDEMASFGHGVQVMTHPCREP